MTICIALLTAVCVALLSHTLLHKQQRHHHRNEAKAQLLATQAGTQPGALGGPQARHQALGSPRQRGLASVCKKLPFIGKALAKQQRGHLSHRLEAELPRMLDILAMGMHAGLSFDAALGLYVRRFNTELAVLCRERFEIWERGLISRSSGLEQLAAKLDLPLFTRFCSTASRSIRHGIPMVPLIKEYADQARTEYRNKQKEQVLKAPVKMLLPTGTLILPAMMMLVIGPIVLDVTERMV